MANGNKCNSLADAYHHAIEDYKTCRRELSECEIAIEVARMLKDTAVLRQALSSRNQLLITVDDAREAVEDAACDVVRSQGMEPKGKEPKEGLLYKILTKIVKS